MTQPVPAHEARELAALTGPGAGVLLQGIVPERITAWQVHTTHHRPGAGVTVGYTATVVGAEGLVEDYLCLTTGPINPDSPHLRRVVGPDGLIVHGWRHPEDPDLPALATACDSAAMGARLGGRVSLELLSYRPTRRAVVRLKADSGTAYAKVVRPNRRESLAKRHVMLTRAGIPAPRLLRCDDDGLVVISACSGTPLANVLSRGMGGDAPAILTSLTRTLDRLPSAALGLTRRPSWSERADHYAHGAITVLPAHRERLLALTRGINELMARSNPGPLVPVHGDFYEANILIEGTTISGLIDVDSLGPGHRVDDLGCLLGHISVLPHLAPRSYPHVPAELEGWIRQCEQQVDPVALNARCAGVTLSLIAGARREDGENWLPDAEGRLAAAEMWLARGRAHLARAQHPALL